MSVVDDVVVVAEIDFVVELLLFMTSLALIDESWGDFESLVMVVDGIVAKIDVVEGDANSILILLLILPLVDDVVVELVVTVADGVVVAEIDVVEGDVNSITIS